MRLFGLKLATESPLRSVSFCHCHKTPSIISLEREKTHFGIQFKELLVHGCLTLFVLGPSPKSRTSSNNATLGIKPLNTLALREKLIQPQGFVEACLGGLRCMHRQRHTLGSPLLGVC